MDEKKFKAIIERYLAGRATPEEVKAVDAFFEGYKTEGKDWPYDIMGDPKESEKRILTGILAKHQSSEKSIQIFSYRSVWRIAATLLIFMMVGYGVYVYQYRQPDAVAVNVLQAGGDKAILKLADGTEVMLDSTGTFAIPKQGNVGVVNENGILSYKADRAPDEILYNTITTPPGGQYQIALADGSSVWLNAVSSLRFPAAFSGAERVVELSGEAYFEIAKNSGMPFKVLIASSARHIAPVEIQVLGTHFNVMAYPEEESILATLLEGTVKISKGSVEGMLHPGEQAQLATDGGLEIIKHYDVSQAIAWKNGKFVFNDTPLAEIMRQVSRWYDVDVVYEDDVRSLQFGGVISRREDASVLLNLLALTGEVNFELKGNNIIVKRAKQ